MSSEFLSVSFRAGLAVLVALAFVPIAPAGAQSFLQSLFGDDAPSPLNPAGGYVRRQSPGFSPYTPSSRPFSLFSPYPSHDDYDRLPPDRTTFRTLCVRMCDGFYFPISNATSSAALTRDAETCAAACGENARLFYYPNPGGDVEDMVDLTGRAYGSYPTAFKYRKTLVKACQCRPQPWSETERARHRAYAAALTPPAGPLDAGPPATKVEPASTGADDTGPATAPLPIDRNALESPAPHPVVPPAGASAPRPVPAKGNTPAMARPSAVSKHVDGGQWNWFSGNTGTGQPKPSPVLPGGR